MSEFLSIWLKLSFVLMFLLYKNIDVTHTTTEDQTNMKRTKVVSERIMVKNGKKTRTLSIYMYVCPRLFACFLLFFLSFHFLCMQHLRDIAPLIRKITLLRKPLGLPMTTVCISLRDLLSGVWYPTLFLWRLTLCNILVFLLLRFFLTHSTIS